MVTYKTVKKISPEKLFNLYDSVSWIGKTNNKKKHALLISKAHNISDAVFSAWDKDELVGVVRVITDGLTHAVIFGLVVSPEYGNKGIATELVKKCIKKYSKMQISLEAEESSYKLFKNIGFKDSPNKYISMGKYVI